MLSWISSRPGSAYIMKQDHSKLTKTLCAKLRPQHLLPTPKESQQACESGGTSARPVVPGYAEENKAVNRKQHIRIADASSLSQRHGSSAEIGQL